MAGLPKLDQSGSELSSSGGMRAETHDKQAGKLSFSCALPRQVGRSSGGISSSVSSTLQSQGLLLKRGET